MSRRDRQRKHAELRATAVDRLRQCIRLRDVRPCEETGLLLARAELSVLLVDAAERDDARSVLALQDAIEGLTRVLDRPRFVDEHHRAALEAAWLN